MVAGLGFEPTASRAEREMLPLHHPAMWGAGKAPRTTDFVGL